MNLKELFAAYEAKSKELDTLLAKGAEMTEADQTAATTLDGELNALDAKIKSAEDLAAMQTKNAQRLVRAASPAVPFAQPQATDPARLRDIDAFTKEMETNDIAAERTRGRLLARATAFKASTRAEANEKAYEFGMWMLAALGNAKAATFCRDKGISVKAHNEGNNAQGGFLVPEQFENDLIDLREMYGVFRQYARVVPMRSDTRSVPRRTGGLTAYFVGENSTITESTKGWDRVSLVAKKVAVLAKYSSEVDEDSVIDMANDLAGEISYAFAALEDDCGFNGDGTSAYGGIVGVRTALKGLSGTIANIAGLIVASGNAYSEAVLSDFEAVVGKLPQYADTPNARWFTHRSYYWNVMIKLMLASGGVTEAEVSQQGRNVPFLGYPVAVSQKLPSVEANSQVCALFGDLRKAAMMGDRRQTTIATSEHLNFAEDEIAIRGTQRFDINVHDVGNASATAGLRVAGPVVALITAAS